ncbi:hypothetical protein, partial [Alicyclobacillus sendaiensis]|uniref:hypothetical protein n=1 Tax=Alicyclobacillus sendaiensis TaxID=192387 RepID=UPI0026F42554
MREGVACGAVFDGADEAARGVGRPFFAPGCEAEPTHRSRPWDRSLAVAPLLTTLDEGPWRNLSIRVAKKDFGPYTPPTAPSVEPQSKEFSNRHIHHFGNDCSSPFLLHLRRGCR